jgi:hypothetical protein
LAAVLLLLTPQLLWAAPFDVRDDPVYGKAKAAVVGYARARHASGLNNFCVLGQLADHGEKTAWIIWRQKHEIILWEGQDLAWVRPRRVLDLNRDTVKSDDDLHGSSYLVTRKWVDDLISECRKAGLQIVVGHRSR